MSEDKANSDEVLTLQEACRFLKVSESTMRRWLREGKIEGYKTNRLWRFFRSELEAWLRDGKN